MVYWVLVFSICVCSCLCGYLFGWVCACAWETKVNFRCCPQNLCTMVFKESFPLVDLEYTNRPGWICREPQGFSFLHLFSSEIKRVCHHITTIMVTIYKYTFEWISIEDEKILKIYKWCFTNICGTEPDMWIIWDLEILKICMCGKGKYPSDLCWLHTALVLVTSEWDKLPLRYPSSWW